jgi:hypothetical protein
MFGKGDHAALQILGAILCLSASMSEHASYNSALSVSKFALSAVAFPPFPSLVALKESTEGVNKLQDSCSRLRLCVLCYPVSGRRGGEKFLPPENQCSHTRSLDRVCGSVFCDLSRFSSLWGRDGGDA